MNQHRYGLRRCALAAVAALLMTAGFAADLRRARPESVGMSSARLERITAFAERLVATKQAAGVVTLVARHGRVVHLNATGMADIEHGVPMTAATYFRYFSMTKPITSVALLILYEEGKFQLTDPLVKFLPEFTGIKVQVGDKGAERLEDAVRVPTIQDVFRHTAGFSYEGGLYDSRSLAELTSRLASRPLSYQPGTRWVYSFSHDVQARLAMP